MSVVKRILWLFFSSAIVWHKRTVNPSASLINAPNAVSIASRLRISLRVCTLLPDSVVILTVVDTQNVASIVGVSKTSTDQQLQFSTSSNFFFANVRCVTVRTAADVSLSAPRFQVGQEAGRRGDAHPVLARRPPRGRYRQAGPRFRSGTGFRPSVPPNRSPPVGSVRLARRTVRPLFEQFVARVARVRNPAGGQRERERKRERRKRGVVYAVDAAAERGFEARGWVPVGELPAGADR